MTQSGIIQRYQCFRLGVVSNGHVRCPWHGACFNIRTGDIEDFPGLDSVQKFDVSKLGLISFENRHAICITCAQISYLTYFNSNKLNFNQMFITGLCGGRSGQR